MYVSEENRFEELLANHFNNSRGWREVLCCDTAENCWIWDFIAPKGISLFSMGILKSKMCMTPVAQVTHTIW